MATGTAQTPLSPPVQASAPATFERFIETQLDKTRSQVKLVDLFSSLLVLAAGVLGFLLVGGTGKGQTPVHQWVGLTLVGAMVIHFALHWTGLKSASARLQNPKARVDYVPALMPSISDFGAR